MANSTVAYGYDELGRVVSQSINGSVSQVGFDDLGRVSQISNPLGQFTYSYDGNTGRLTNVLMPNDMNSSFNYFGIAKQHRLKDISHTKSNTNLVSKFSYDYDSDGQITSWTQQADAQTPTVYTYSYDAIGQLLQAVQKNSNGDLLRTYAYGYDPAGNRISTQSDGLVATDTVNEGNQLIQRNVAPMTAESMAKAAAAASVASKHGKSSKPLPKAKARPVAKPTTTQSSK